MKKLLLFTIIFWLVNPQSSSACWFEPEGEYVRFHLLNTNVLQIPGEYAAFLYSANGYLPILNENEYDENVTAWQNLVDGKVSKAVIADFLYNDFPYAWNANSSNDFVRYLYRHQKKELISYLLLAKECEPYNSIDYDNDPWERKTKVIHLHKERNLLIQKISKQLSATKNSELRRRYAFLAIRLAHYNEDDNTTITFFNQYFNANKKDFLYYWSLYFKSLTNQGNSLDYANVLVNSSQKAPIMFLLSRDKFSIKEALHLAKSDEERAGAYIFASMQNLAPNLENLEQIYRYHASSKFFDFLLFREIQKLEDWIYTPYYSNYLPSTELRFNWEEKRNINSLITRKRSEKDRNYARQVLQFVQRINLDKVSQPQNIQIAEIQLLFMSRKFDECLKKIAIYFRKNPNRPENKELEQIKALTLISMQKKEKFILTPEIQEIILKYKDERPFLFASGRELEFLNQFPEAVALISSMEKLNTNDDYDYENEPNYIFWQGNHSNTSTNLFYFDRFFNYIDYTYSAQQVKTVVESLKNIPNDAFHRQMFDVLLQSKNNLYDLLGTKYIRENNLNAAMNAFKSAKEKYWEENYNNWGKGKYDGSWVFDKNPFYDISNTPDFIPDRKDFRLTKVSVLEHLIDYIAKSEDKTNPKNAYYSFLVATCYYNMSQYGNSWMMRRFRSTSNYNFDQPNYSDEKEYRENNLAKKYYHQAYIQAKNKRFKALALRMEEWVNGQDSERYSWHDKNKQQPKNRLLREFPEYYSRISNCYNLNEFFKL